MRVRTYNVIIGDIMMASFVYLSCVLVYLLFASLFWSFPKETANQNIPIPMARVRRYNVIIGDITIFLFQYSFHRSVLVMQYQALQGQ